VPKPANPNWGLDDKGRRHSGGYFRDRACSFAASPCGGRFFILDIYHFKNEKGLWEMKEKEYKTGCIKITVSYGYDIHSIKFSKRTYDRILTGEYVKIKGPKFVCEGVDGKFPQDYWVFNREGPGSVYRSQRGQAYTFYKMGKNMNG